MPVQRLMPARHLNAREVFRAPSRDGCKLCLRTASSSGGRDTASPASDCLARGMRMGNAFALSRHAYPREFFDQIAAASIDE